MESRIEPGLSIKLQHAVSALRVDEVKALLEQQALPSELLNNTTALHLAVQFPQTEKNKRDALLILEMLLDYNGDINQLATYRTVMSQAAHNLFWEAVLLIASKRKTDREDRGHYSSALIDSVRYCKKDEALLKSIIQNLLDADALDNRHSSNGYTSLHWAVENNKPFALQMILSKFPDEYMRKGGVEMTPARMAFDKEHWSCLEVIAQFAYLPIIEGKRTAFPVELKHEKDIIYKYVCSLPAEFMWQAIINGQTKTHPLGNLNHMHKNGINIGEPNTIGLYAQAEAKLREQGYPSALTKSKPIPVVQRQSPTIASMIIPPNTPNWMITDYVDDLGEKKRQRDKLRRKSSYDASAKTTSNLSLNASSMFQQTPSLAIPVKSSKPRASSEPSSPNVSTLGSPLKDFFEHLWDATPPHETHDEGLKLMYRFSS